MAHRMNDIPRVLVALTGRLTTRKGQGLVEYGLILAAVAIAVVLALTALSGQLNAVFSSVVTALQGL